MANGMEWTDEKKALLTELWTANLISTKQIGLRLGCSKNAVVGKAGRMGLPSKESPILAGALGGRGFWTVERQLELKEIGHTMTVRVLAEHFGCPCESVRETCRSLNVKPLVASGGVRRTHTLPKLASIQPPSEAPPDVPAAAPPVALPDIPDRPVWRLASKPVIQAPPPRAPAPVVAPYGRVTDCMWPLGEPGTKAFRFCDDRSMPGKPYCEDHAKLAYRHLVIQQDHEGDSP